MTIQSFDYCALHYLNQWIDKDRRFIEILENGTDDSRLFALKDAAVFYRVARTLHTRRKTKRIETRYGHLLKLLDEVRVSDYQSGTEEKIEMLQGAVQEKYKRNKTVISLLTKMLWLRVNEPIIIFDANVRRALKLNDKVSLPDFYEEWRTRYRDRERAIQSACDRLPARHRYVITPSKIYDDDDDPERLTRDEIRDLAKARWFQERVFDIYLWHNGTK